MSVAFVADSNVVVRAQLVQHELAAPYRVFSAIFAPGFEHYLTAQVADEYLAVLLRPSVQRRHLLTTEEVEELVERVRLASLEVSAPRARVNAPDEGDQHLWNLLAAYPDVTLVTGDPLLLQSGDFPGRVLAPREFVERFLA